MTEEEYQEKVVEKVSFFAERINDKLNIVEPFYEPNFILFCGLRKIWYENLNCILLGLHQASIMMTNHLVERMIKEALIGFYICGYYIGMPEFTTKLSEAKRNYDTKPLGKTIWLAHHETIISDNEKETLEILKKKYRDPYSHAQLSQFTNKEPAFTGFSVNISDGLQALRDGKELNMTPKSIDPYVLAQEFQFENAREESFSYLQEVFKIMRSIDDKYQEKMRLNNSTN